jgi:hypothetical protein
MGIPAFLVEIEINYINSKKVS